MSISILTGVSHSPFNCGHHYRLSWVIALHQIIAYNPAANGMGEHFYHTLKAAVMSHCNDSNWFTQLSWVLLGWKATLWDGLDVLAAEMVYCDLLVISAEFLPSAASSDNLQCLCHVVGKFTPSHQTYKLPAKHYIPKELHTTMNVFLHYETSKLLLMAPHMGHFLVI
ncbi:uncharacterized protein [Palaemon carinicauda]|uniref:uncharacterized protein n=1 Tax=Palaemon carinicauda TaxID=392227 RepID=UPI0035B5F2DD